MTFVLVPQTLAEVFIVHLFTRSLTTVPRWPVPYMHARTGDRDRGNRKRLLWRRSTTNRTVSCPKCPLGFFFFFVNYNSVRNQEKGWRKTTIICITVAKMLTVILHTGGGGGLRSNRALFSAFFLSISGVTHSCIFVYVMSALWFIVAFRAYRRKTEFIYCPTLRISTSRPKSSGPGIFIVY